MHSWISTWKFTVRPRPLLRCARVLTFLFLTFSFFPVLPAFGAYKIGPGDVLEITVWRFEDMSGKFKVTNDGTISHFLMGDVKVADLDAEEVRRKITGILGEKYIRNPKVKVVVREFHNFRVSLLGEVKNPGIVEFEREVNLLDAIIHAGGPTENAGKTVTIYRERKSDDEGNLDYTVIKINLHEIFQNKGGSSNIVLRNKDVVLVSSEMGDGFTDRVMENALNRFYVVGQVNAPGAYPYVKGYTVLNAVLDAGGIAKFASPNSTRVVRNGPDGEASFEVKLGDILYNGERETDIAIKPGDMIIVPKGIY